MNKPRWACAACGMYSSRRYSVQRHTTNLHDGLANIVSFVDYSAGRRQATYYFSNPIPTYLLKQQSQTATGTTTVNQPLNIFKEELLRSAVRKRFGYS